MIVRVIDADHEPVLVPYHFKSPEVVTARQCGEEECERDAQEARFEAARQVEQRKIDAALQRFGQCEAQLPAARDQPVNQNRENDYREDVAAKIRPEGKI